MPDELQEIQISSEAVAGLFDPGIEASLPPAEREALTVLFVRNNRVDLAIPDDMDPDDLMRTLEMCVRVYVRARQAMSHLKLLIGRALIVIQNNPEIYRRAGYNSFEGFISQGMPAATGICRAELFKAKSVAQSLGPGLSLEAVRTLGLTKLQLIAGVTEAGSASQTRLMNAARTDTIPQLRERIARNGLAEADALTWDALTFNVTTAQKTFILAFFNNPQVRAYCETDSAGLILERMVQECQNEWEVQMMVAENELRDA